MAELIVKGRDALSFPLVNTGGITINPASSKLRVAYVSYRKFRLLNAYTSNDILINAGGNFTIKIEIVAGEVPEGLVFTKTQGGNLLRTNLQGDINIYDSIFTQPVEAHGKSYPTEGQRIRYYFVLRSQTFFPLTATLRSTVDRLFYFDLDLNWSQIRDAFISSVQNQQFSIGNGVSTARDFIDFQKSQGYYK